MMILVNEPKLPHHIETQTYVCFNTVSLRKLIIEIYVMDFGCVCNITVV